jgi:hypothetical protein
LLKFSFYIDIHTFYSLKIQQRNLEQNGISLQLFNLTNFDQILH